MIPWPCTNEEYEKRMAEAIARAKAAGVTHIAFGDLFLQDLRAYREQRMADSGIQPLFPLWTSPDRTAALAREMVAAGLRGRVTCIDPRKLDPSFAGRVYDAQFLEDLPAGVDPCAENGEFHTACCAGPMFARPVPLVPGEVLERDGYWFADFMLTKR
jgi:diphthamide synthase (EF-2-diphthine--ammonia ligase)